MSLAVDLGGVGMPMEQALRLGFTPANVTAAGTVAGTATQIPGIANQVFLTAAANQTGAMLPALAELMLPYIVTNISGIAGVIYPPTGGAINGGASVALAANASRMFMRLSATQWASWITA